MVPFPLCHRPGVLGSSARLGRGLSPHGFRGAHGAHSDHGCPAHDLQRLQPGWRCRSRQDSNIRQLETWWMVKHDNCGDDDDDEEEEAPRRRRKIGFHSRCLVDLCCAFQKFGSIQDVLGRLGPRCMKKVSPKQIYQQNAAATRGSKCIHDKSVREPSGPVRDSIAWQRFFQPRVGPWFHRLRIGVWPGAPVARLHCEVMVVLVGL